MAYDIIMPKLGQTVEEGRIVEWLKEEGDPVDRGEVLLTIETDKAVLDVESKKRGVLRKILVPEGETRPVLTVVGIMTRTPDEPLEVPETAEAADEAAEPKAQAPEDKAPAPQPERPSGRIFASPRARKYAREHGGVDLAQIEGSGPNGRIVERDVIAYLETAKAEAPDATPVARNLAEHLGVDLADVAGTGRGGRITKADVVRESEKAEERESEKAREPAGEEAPVAAEVPMTGVRALIAQRMHESHQTTAPVTLTMEVDATAFKALRERLKVAMADELGFNLSYNDLLIHVAARALRAFPYVNARLDDGVIRHLDAVHVGLAIDTERGLLVPVVRDAHRKGLAEIARDVRELVTRTRAGKALPDDLTGGTFTITNLGMYGVDAFTPIINYPETAILGVGRIKAQPAVVDGAVCVRQMLWLSLTFDHRLVDGAPAARFLQHIQRLIEEPYLLLA
jgi:pyruvate dehydrogenase E2 component (dihydrolipoamide acetyltransferase)